MSALESIKFRRLRLGVHARRGLELLTEAHGPCGGLRLRALFLAAWHRAGNDFSCLPKKARRGPSTGLGALGHVWVLVLLVLVLRT